MKALVIGATGLTGSSLLEQLTSDTHFTEITVLARRSTQVVSEKVTEHTVDFDKPESWKHLITGDVLFSALGTTLKLAGSKQAQYTVDYHYQLAVAKAAAENGVGRIVLISSYGADAKSGVFYLKMKGELEESIMQLGFKNCVMLRPGQIDGKHSPQRAGEKFALKAVKALNRCSILKRYTPITPQKLATAMINAALLNEEKNITIVELEQVHKLAEKQIV